MAGPWRGGLLLALLGSLSLPLLCLSPQDPPRAKVAERGGGGLVREPLLTLAEAFRRPLPTLPGAEARGGAVAQGLEPLLGPQKVLPGLVPGQPASGISNRKDRQVGDMKGLALRPRRATVRQRRPPWP